jgi:hypothetical protein
MHLCTKSAETAVDPSLFGRVLDAAKNSSPLALQPMTGKMHQQHVVGQAFREQLFDMRLDDVGGLVAHHLNSEITDLPVTEHPAERLGVRRRGQQVPQGFLVILVVGDDQGLPLAAHRNVK